MHLINNEIKKKVENYFENINFMRTSIWHALNQIIANKKKKKRKKNKKEKRKKVWFD